MLTDAKLRANRQNALFSTGPRTEEGKATSSRNACKHGLTAQTALLPGEDVAEFQAILFGFLDAHQPADAMETALILNLVDLEWRLRRASRHEARILSAENPDYHALNNISLHAARIKRQFSASLKELRESQKETRPISRHHMELAETITKADRILNRPSTLPVGFEFTLDDLKVWCGLYDHVRRCQKIVDASPNPDDREFADIGNVPEAGPIAA